MITYEQKIELMDVLGSRFSKDVRNILLERKIYTQGADTYSAGYISNVLNGRYEHLEIESAIYELCARRTAAKALIESRKNALKKKKPVDGHPQVDHN